MEDFSKQKIVWLTISDKPKFAIDDSGAVCLNSTFILTGNKLYTILCCLSSKLIEWYFDGICVSTGEGTNKWEKFVVERIPILFTSQEVENDFNQQINNRITNPHNSQVIDNYINNCVYKLYNLSQDEIDFIESL